MEEKSLTLSAIWKASQPFVFGGLSGMIATTCIQPIDMVKVSIQIHGKGGATNPFVVATKLIRQDGFFSLYRGLSAGLFRQATYTTARMGIFRTICDRIKAPDGSLSFMQRAGAGLAAGGLGAVVGTPFDLALIRMQADSSLPLAERRNYKGVFDALFQISRSEGFFGLFSGCLPTGKFLII